MKTRWIRALFWLLGCASLVVGVFTMTGKQAPKEALPTDVRMPATDPPVDPDRPDLFEEPKIEPRPEL